MLREKVLTHTLEGLKTKHGAIDYNLDTEIGRTVSDRVRKLWTEKYLEPAVAACEKSLALPGEGAHRQDRGRSRTRRPFGRCQEGGRPRGGGSRIGTAMNRSETVKIIGLLATASLVGAPDAETLPKTVALYAEMLADVPFAAVLQGVRAHLADATPGHDGRPVGRWWMTIADIMARVEKQDEPRLLGEWARVTKLVSDGQPFDPSPAMRRAIEACGGSWEIRMRPADDAKMRATFLRAYRESEAAAPKQLEGGGT